MVSSHYLVSPSTLLWSWVCPCRQSFKNCSGMASFLRVQSLRNRLLQDGSPVGSQILPEELLQGLLSTGPARSLFLFQQGLSVGSRFLQGATTCSSRGSSMLCTVDIWLPVGTSSVLEGLRFGKLGSVLELAVSVMGTTPGFWQKPPLQLLADKTWLCKPNTPLSVSQDIGKQHYLSFQPFWLNQIFKWEILILSCRNC